MAAKVGVELEEGWYTAGAFSVFDVIEDHMLEADCGGDLGDRDRGAPLLDAPQLYAKIFGMPGVCVRFGWERGRPALPDSTREYQVG